MWAKANHKRIKNKMAEHFDSVRVPCSSHKEHRSFRCSLAKLSSNTIEPAAGLGRWVSETTQREWAAKWQIASFGSAC